MQTRTKETTRRRLHALSLIWVASALLATTLLPGQRVLSPPTDPGRELALLVRTLNDTGRLLYVTAHPDDEDARLLARLRHKQGVETALLTLTRGEGGQNEIGPELFAAIGVLRSRELEAAGQYTGVRQLFSSARDFGYSFSKEETFEKWGRENILREIVRHIRSFRPDVLLTMLTDPAGGGQHHQASAELSAEAFDIAATAQWPELGEPHKTARLFRQIWDASEPPNVCSVPLNEYDPILGGTYVEIGRESRAQHKCQGMARLGATRGLHSRWQWLRGEGDPPEDDLFSGWSPQWNGLLGAALRAIEQEAGKAEAKLRIDKPKVVLTTLVRLWHKIRALAQFDLTAIELARVETMTQRCARAIQLAAGTQVRARSAQRWLRPGSPWGVEFDVSSPNESGRLYYALRSASGDVLTSGEGSWTSSEPGWSTTLSVTAPKTPTLPIATPSTTGVVQEELRWSAFAKPRWQSFFIEATLMIADPTATPDKPSAGLRIPLPPIPVECAEINAEFPTIFHSDPQVVPDPALSVAQVVRPIIVEPQSNRSASPVEVSVEVSALSDGKVLVEPVAPTGWVVEPKQIGVTVTGRAAAQTVRFRAQPPQAITQSAALRFRARYEASGEGSGEWSSAGYRVVEYPHTRPAALLTDPAVELRPIRCNVPARRVAFVEGAGGDEMLWALRVLGVSPTVLTARDVEDGDLARFDVIVTGVRAYKVRRDLIGAHSRLMEWMRAGGTLVVQYNKFEFNAGRDESPFAPFPGAAVSRRRVTVEEAPIDVVTPEHPFVTFPNRLGADDWQGWVQERGLYFLDAPTPPYLDLIAVADPWPNNPGRHTGSLVTAEVGKGRWVYVGLALFRQLPAGPPAPFACWPTCSRPSPPSKSHPLGASEGLAPLRSGTSMQKIAKGAVLDLQLVW